MGGGQYQYLRCLAILALLGSYLIGSFSMAQEMRFFRIGTGGIGGTYYPIGGLIVQAISHPPDSRPCDEGGSCGVPGLVAVAQSSRGSLDNIAAIQAGTLESGFVQSDAAYWAYTGADVDGHRREPVTTLRAITSLYAESVHLIARQDSDIDSVADLWGKRVSLDEEGSGTLMDVRLILQAFGLSEQNLQTEYLKPIPSLHRLQANELDAFFMVAGYPIPALAELPDTQGVKLVPITGPPVETLLESYGFFSHDHIPAGTYQNSEAVATISVNALWVVDARADTQLIYAITQALWHESARQLLDRGHAKGQEITLETALDGLAIPLHPGAQQFYQEVGMLVE